VLLLGQACAPIALRALQCIKTAGELGGFKENSEGIVHPLTIHTRNPWIGPMRGWAVEVQLGGCPLRYIEEHQESRRRGLVGFLYLGRCLSSV
jgi:hypothetical protein